MSVKRSKIIKLEVRYVYNIALQKCCSLQDALASWASEAPVPGWLYNAVQQKLGV